MTDTPDPDTAAGTAAVVTIGQRMAAAGIHPDRIATYLAARRVRVDDIEVDDPDHPAPPRLAHRRRLSTPRTPAHLSGPPHDPRPSGEAHGAGG